jgi:hypothetical protein
MSTEEQRRIYPRDGDGDPSDLQDAEWGWLEPTIPPVRRGDTVTVNPALGLVLGSVAELIHAAIVRRLVAERPGP